MIYFLAYTSLHCGIHKGTIERSDIKLPPTEIYCTLNHLATPDYGGYKSSLVMDTGAASQLK